MFAEPRLTWITEVCAPPGSIAAQGGRRSKRYVPGGFIATLEGARSRYSR